MSAKLSLFEQNDTNDYIALVLVFSEEDIYFIKTGKEITSDYLNKQLEALDANTWISPDLKKNLHLMKAGGFTPDERKKYFDMTVAAYLLNPLLGIIHMMGWQRTIFRSCYHLKRTILENSHVNR